MVDILLSLTMPQKMQLLQTLLKGDGANSQVLIGHFQNKTSGLDLEKDKGWESYTYPSKMEFIWQVNSDSTNWTNITAANDTVSVSSGNNDITNVVYTVHTEQIHLK